MRETIHADRIGKTDALLTVHFGLPLADSEAIGNFGLEGMDEDSMNRVFPNAALARSGATRLRDKVLKRYPDAVNFDWRIDVRRWDEDIFDDPTFGRIRDAVYSETHVQYGYPDDSGAVVWGELERV
jgi:hypothetical protein